MSCLQHTCFFYLTISLRAVLLFFSISGPTLEYLPEIFEKLLNRLDELLTAGRTSKSRVIANITAETKLELFFETVELLEKVKISKGDAGQFRHDIGNLKKTTTNELLTGIRDLLLCKQTSSDDSSHSAANADVDTVNRLRDVMEQMLVVNGIPPENAKQAVDDLEKDVLDETLTNIKSVVINLEAIRKHDQLIKFNINTKQKETIIIEALKKGGCTLRKRRNDAKRCECFVL